MQNIGELSKYVKEAISNWESISLSLSGFKYLNSGTAINLSNSEIEQLVHAAETSVYCYLGVVEETLKFYFLSDLEDKEEKYTNIVESQFESDNLGQFSDYTFGISENSELTLQEAGSRVINWNFEGSIWFNEQIKNQNPMVRVFTIPKADLENALESNKAPIKLCFGLRNNTSGETNSKYMLELIVGFARPISATEVGSLFLSNLTHPHPPFSISQGSFTLL
ncbi:MAG: hypothetical protein ACPG6V_07990 [Flavobacteriales bacterium]